MDNTKTLTPTKKFRIEIERLMKVSLKDFEDEELQKKLLTSLLGILDILDGKKQNE